MVADGVHDACAAPARAGELLRLEAIAEGVADVRGARTRFVLVGRPGTPTPRTGVDRTSVSFTLRNEPGTLMRSMNEFAVRDINLTRIESRPTRESMGATGSTSTSLGIDDLRCRRRWRRCTCGPRTCGSSGRGPPRRVRRTSTPGPPTSPTR